MKVSAKIKIFRRNKIFQKSNEFYRELYSKIKSITIPLFFNQKLVIQKLSLKIKNLKSASSLIQKKRIQKVFYQTESYLRISFNTIQSSNISFVLLHFKAQKVNKSELKKQLDDDDSDQIQSSNKPSPSKKTKLTRRQIQSKRRAIRAQQELEDLHFAKKLSKQFEMEEREHKQMTNRFKHNQNFIWAENAIGTRSKKKIIEASIGWGMLEESMIQDIDSNNIGTRSFRPYTRTERGRHAVSRWGFEEDTRKAIELSLRQEKQRRKREQQLQKLEERQIRMVKEESRAMRQKDNATAACGKADRLIDLPAMSFPKPSKFTNNTSTIHLNDPADHSDQSSNNSNKRKLNRKRLQKGQERQLQNTTLKKKIKIEEVDSQSDEMQYQDEDSQIYESIKLMQMQQQKLAWANSGKRFEMNHTIRSSQTMNSKAKNSDQSDCSWEQEKRKKCVPSYSKPSKQLTKNRQTLRVSKLKDSHENIKNNYQKNGTKFINSNKRSICLDREKHDKNSKEFSVTLNQADTVIQNNGRNVRKILDMHVRNFRQSSGSPFSHQENEYARNYYKDESSQNQRNVSNNSSDCSNDHSDNSDANSSNSSCYNKPRFRPVRFKGLKNGRNGIASSHAKKVLKVLIDCDQESSSSDPSSSSPIAVYCGPSQQLPPKKEQVYQSALEMGSMHDNQAQDKTLPKVLSSGILSSIVQQSESMESQSCGPFMSMQSYDMTSQYPQSHQYLPHSTAVPANRNTQQLAYRPSFEHAYAQKHHNEFFINPEQIQIPPNIQVNLKHNIEPHFTQLTNNVFQQAPSPQSFPRPLHPVAQNLQTKLPPIASIKEINQNAPEQIPQESPKLKYDCQSSLNLNNENISTSRTWLARSVQNMLKQTQQTVASGEQSEQPRTYLQKIIQQNLENAKKQVQQVNIKTGAAHT